MRERPIIFSGEMDEFTINGPDPKRPGVIMPHVVLLGGRVVCRNCALCGCAAFDDLSAAFRHMLAHARAGHVVRRGLLDGLAVASAVLTARGER